VLGSGLANRWARRQLRGITLVRPWPNGRRFGNRTRADAGGAIGFGGAAVCAEPLKGLLETIGLLAMGALPIGMDLSVTSRTPIELGTQPLEHGQ
jgi:hypothetical protein